MNELLNKLDHFYQNQQFDEALAMMLDEYQKAQDNHEYELLLLLDNELMGFYRVHSQFERAQIIVEHAKQLIYEMNLDETIDGATTYLNIAALYRQQGYIHDALEMYQKTYSIYQKYLDESDEHYIALFNNISLVYFDKKQYFHALDYGYRALALIENKDDCIIETAITYANLSQFHFALRQYDKGYECILKSKQLFKNNGTNDPHYYALLNNEAIYYYQKHHLFKAHHIYQEILIGLKKLYGENQDFKHVKRNDQILLEEMNRSFGLNLCESYYFDIGKPMLENAFSNYMSKMSIGLVGMGSECLGYDDEISRDHDFGPGFCIWLPKKDYREIGFVLQNAYNQLTLEYEGFKRENSKRGQGRLGVFCIEDFFIIPQSLMQWLEIDEYLLCMLTGGRIFDDFLGEVTSRRKILKYYPEDVRLKKLAKSVAKMAQSGQYNYLRCLKRHDYVAASLALNEFIDEALSCIYLLNKKYKPYYKWAFHGLKDCNKLTNVSDLLEELVFTGVYQKEQTIELIEKICSEVIVELKQQSLSNVENDFLDNHVDSIMNKIVDQEIRSMHIMEG